MHIPKQRSSDAIFPDYPSNARTFITLDSKLLPYWHLIFDLSPVLLKLDPPDGLKMFRRFMSWAYRNQPSQDWTFHVSLCRWLLNSKFAPEVSTSHVESLLSAAAARWASNDYSRAKGILIACSVIPTITLEWKSHNNNQGINFDLLPPARMDFAWSPLTGSGEKGFQRWLRIPE